MTSVDQLHTWMVVHPISQNCIIAAAFGSIFLLLGRYWNELAAITRLPPQRFGAWWKAARITVLERRIAQLRRAHEEPQYFIRFAFTQLAVALGYIGLSVVFTQLFLMQSIDSKLFPAPPHRVIGAHEHLIFRIVFLGTIVSTLYRMGYSLYQIIYVASGVSNHPEELNDLLRRFYELDV